jgi:hypothetical protein
MVEMWARDINTKSIELARIDARVSTSCIPDVSAPTRGGDSSVG